MTYLYGDSSDSGLELNYIELLRDFLDFATQIMLSEHRIESARKDADEQKRLAQIELDRLRALSTEVNSALDASCGPNVKSSTDRCIANLRNLTQDTLRRAAEEIKAQLASNENKVGVGTQRERAANSKISERLLLHHTLPDSQNTVDILVNSDGLSYQARVRGGSKQGLRWLFAAEIPESNRFQEVLKMASLVPDLVINLPEMSGLLRKTVKLKPYRVAPLYIVSLQQDGPSVVLKLRAAPSPNDPTGLDLKFAPSQDKVLVVRIDKGEPAEEFETSQEDSAALIELVQQLEPHRQDLIEQRSKLLTIQFDGKDLSDCPDPTVLLKRLMQRIGPVIRSIADHSLADSELVLKRVLANDRREEIFASRADMLSKIAPVPITMRGIFAPLGLGDLGDSFDDSSIGEDPPTRPLSTLAVERQTLEKQLQSQKSHSIALPRALSDDDDDTTSVAGVPMMEDMAQEMMALAPDDEIEAMPEATAGNAQAKPKTNIPPIPVVASTPNLDSIDTALAELEAES